MHNGWSTHSTEIQYSLLWCVFQLGVVFTQCAIKMSIFVHCTSFYAHFKAKVALFRCVILRYFFDIMDFSLRAFFLDESVFFFIFPKRVRPVSEKTDIKLRKNNFALYLAYLDMELQHTQRVFDLRHF